MEIHKKTHPIFIWFEKADDTIGENLEKSLFDQARLLVVVMKRKMGIRKKKSCLCYKEKIKVNGEGKY